VLHGTQHQEPDAAPPGFFLQESLVGVLYLVNLLQFEVILLIKGPSFVFQYETRHPKEKVPGDEIGLQERVLVGFFGFGLGGLLIFCRIVV
jgi:hypothetical protein